MMQYWENIGWTDEFPDIDWRTNIIKIEVGERIVVFNEAQELERK